MSWSGEKKPDVGSMLKVEPGELAERWNEGCERKKRIFKDDSEVCWLKSLKWGKVIGGAGFRGRSGLGCVKFERSVRLRKKPMLK